MERLYGQAVMPISTLVDKFCLKQGNTREVGFIRYLSFAEWAWKELFRTTIWAIKRQVLHVDCKTNTIKLPNDCERLVNISVVDRYGKLHPLSGDPDFNTSQINCQKCACSCSHCKGENTLCHVVDNITMTTEMVTIQGDEYPLTTWIRYDRTGALQKEEKIPTWDTSTESVIYVTEYTTLCNLDIDDHGCIKATAPNMEFLVSYTGWNGLGWNGVAYSNTAIRRLIPTSYNNWGYWNKNAQDPTIIHIFRNSITGNHQFLHGDNMNTRHDVINNPIEQVIVSYQTSGDNGGSEILIPEYAEMAIDAGMIYQQRLFNPKDTDRDQSGHALWRREQMAVMKHLNPIRMEAVTKLQTELRRW